MDFSTTPIDTLISYQLALATAVEVLRGYEFQNNVDLSKTRDMLAEINDKVNQALKDEQFEIDKEL